MPVLIDGTKYQLAEITGTDLKLLMDFCRNNKLKGGVFIYYDDDNQLTFNGFYKNKKGEKDIHRIWCALYAGNERIGKQLMNDR